jgi:hypothetical protein
VAAWPPVTGRKWLAIAAGIGYVALMNDNPSMPPVPPSNKGLPVIGWVGIGCGTLIVIAVVVVTLMVGWFKRTVGDLSEFKKNPEKAAAELMVKMNPELTKVSQDEAKGEMTIRTKDGHEMTMSYKDISAGKFTVKDAQGNTAQLGQSDLSNVPAWVPRVPQMKSAAGSFQNKDAGKTSGLYTATTTESVDGLENFFKEQAGILKLTQASRTAIQADGVETRNLSYEGAGRMLTIILTGKPGADVQVNVAYTEQ